MHNGLKAFWIMLRTGLLLMLPFVVGFVPVFVLLSVLPAGAVGFVFLSVLVGISIVLGYTSWKEIKEDLDRDA